MSKVTAIILTKNSENVIADCIESVSFCDEILVIDDGSVDRTADLAKRLGAKVENPKLSENNFAEKREYGLKKAKYKWVLYVDSDERVGAELRKSILEVVNLRKPEYPAYKVNRKNFYFGNHEWPHIESMERLFEKSALKGWEGVVHESPVVEGKTGQLDGYLLHYTHRDLASMVKKTIVWSKIEADLRFRAGHPAMKWWRFPRVMATGFLDSYVRQKGYKAGTVGLIESMYQAFSMFVTYARLWELQRRKKNISAHVK